MKTIKSILLLSLLCSSSFAQTANTGGISFPSPNAASFGLYTDVPVSKFTGTPDISIPIYEIVQGDFKMPIILSYHPSAVRVHSHPGWTGLGWSLMAGGAISRTTYGQIDERTHKSNDQGTGFYSNYSKLAGSDTDWLSASRLTQYANDYYPSLDPRLEAMPDEFSFNFLGYSGKFFMGHDGQWKVVSDDQIKVEFNPGWGEGFIRESGLRANILDRINAYGAYSTKYNWSDRYFNKFTLVTPDGVKFEFGGVNATEYLVPYKSQEYAGPEPITWFLTKITIPTGQVIQLNYEPGDIITSMSKQYLYSSSSRDAKQSGWSNFSKNFPIQCSNSTGPTEINDGVIMFPVYLTSITYPKGSIYFDKQQTNELTWPTNFDIDAGIGQGGTWGALPVYFKPLTTPGVTGFGNQRKWYKLNRIRITDMTVVASSSLKHFEFSYDDQPTSRLKLLSLKEISYASGAPVENPPYLFTYNPRKLPGYDEIKSNDHWDFYNGLPTSNFSLGSSATDFQQFYKSREPDISGEFLKAEILEQIQYPTGGAVSYEYEPHTFSKVVDRENPSFPVIDVGSNKIAGGLRVKRISHYNNITDSRPALIKDYYYVRNYTSQSVAEQLSSSGVLGGYPKYYWENYTGRDSEGVLFQYSIFSSGAVRSFGYNISGSHIGYSEVVETSRSTGNAVNGFTIYKFSNFDVDIWSESHPDEIGVSSDPSRSVYSPYSDNQFKRGKLLSEEIYSSDFNNPVRRTRYKYQISNSQYVRRVLQDPFDLCTSTTAGAQTCYVTAFKTYMTRYNLISKETTEYDGTEMFSTETDYTYNTQNFLHSETVNNSDGTYLENTYKYPLDFTTDPNVTGSDWKVLGLNKLINSYIINVPIESIQKKDGLLIAGSFTGYKVFNNTALPHMRWNIESSNALQVGSVISNGSGLDSDKFNPSGLQGSSGNFTLSIDEHYSSQPIVFNKYGTNGNLLEVYSNENTVTSYLWSYMNTFPVAEIIGADYNQVTAAAIANSIDLTFTSNDLLSDVLLRTRMNAIRTSLPNAQMVSYTYNQYGITSKTDANGQIIFYEYDQRGRLAAVKDNEGKILQVFDYHQSGQN